MLLMRSYKADVSRVARHLDWPEPRVQAAVNYAEAFPEEIQEALSENDSVDFATLKRLTPQAVEFAGHKGRKA
jgi:hypothetical protein